MEEENETNNLHNNWNNSYNIIIHNLVDKMLLDTVQISTRSRFKIMKDRTHAKAVCPDCGVVVSDLGKHKRRNRCDDVWGRRGKRTN